MNVCLLTSFFLSAILLELGPKVVEVEIADTEESRKKGLMGRESLAPDTGMLFIFDAPKILVFWMKNTTIPLSVAFFDEDGELINWEEMAPAPKEEATIPLYSSEKPALYALEMPRGWFRRNKIIPGMKFSIENTSLDPSISVK